MVTQSALLLFSKICISCYLNCKFPIFKAPCPKPLSKAEKEPILQNVKGLIVHQFSSIAIHSTDNIIISAFSGLGIVAVGLISNYNLLINSVLGFVVIVFNSVTCGFGNLVASSSTEHYRKTFLELNFLNFWLYGFCCIAFFILIPPFITLWIGAENLIDPVSFSLILTNAYLLGQCTIYNNVRVAKGDFNKDKWWSLVQALINLVVSIIGAKFLGLVGVYIGTVASRMVFVIFRPYSTYQFLFHKSPSEYYKKLIVYFTATLVAGIITYVSTHSLLTEVTITKFVLAVFIVAIIPNFLFGIMFCKTSEYKHMIERMKNIILREKAM